MYGSVTRIFSSLSVITDRTVKTMKAVEPNEEDIDELSGPVIIPLHAYYIISLSSGLQESGVGLLFLPFFLSSLADF
jgi:hypothetical protein